MSRWDPHPIDVHHQGELEALVDVYLASCFESREIFLRRVGVLAVPGPLDAVDDHHQDELDELLREYSQSCPVSRAAFQRWAEETPHHLIEAHDAAAVELHHRREPLMPKFDRDGGAA
jgi:hypothetical protein